MRLVSPKLTDTHSVPGTRAISLALSPRYSLVMKRDQLSVGRSPRVGHSEGMPADRERVSSILRALRLVGASRRGDRPPPPRDTHPPRQSSPRDTHTRRMSSPRVLSRHARSAPPPATPTASSSSGGFGRARHPPPRCVVRGGGGPVASGGGVGAGRKMNRRGERTPAVSALGRGVGARSAVRRFDPRRETPPKSAEIFPKKKR